MVMAHAYAVDSSSATNWGYLSKRRNLCIKGRPNRQELPLLIMDKTAPFCQIKIIIYKLRQQFNPSLILGNTSFTKRWPPLHIEHLHNSIKLIVSAHILRIFHNIYFLGLKVDMLRYTMAGGKIDFCYLF